MVNTIWSMGGGKSFDTLRSLGQKIPGVNRLINKPVARHSGNLDDLANVQKSVDKGVRNQIKKTGVNLEDEVMHLVIDAYQERGED